LHGRAETREPDVLLWRSALAELADAGIPKGVFNVITGNSRAISGELTT
jgi:acyl-CoA reductase-like NAD-dependent aldehyde dehydrogenase